MCYWFWTYGIMQVLLAIRSQGGEQALLQTMNRARELYAQRLQATPSVDELASLLAQCAIAEAQSTNANPRGPGSDPVDMLNSDETCILSVSGRKQIILDAFADGSSFICLKCGGLYSTSRKDEHLAYWCGTAWSCWHLAVVHVWSHLGTWWWSWYPWDFVKTWFSSDYRFFTAGMPEMHLLFVEANTLPTPNGKCYEL